MSLFLQRPLDGADHAIGSGAGSGTRDELDVPDRLPSLRVQAARRANRRQQDEYRSD